MQRTVLKKLTFLNLSGNQIRNLTPLARLTSLQHLELAHNRIVDLAPLRALEKWQDLYLDGNQIADLKPLVEMAHPSGVEYRTVLLRANPLSAEARTVDVAELKKSISNVYADH
jgi:Leucine-rich repeat (LRR) protein